MVWPLIQRAGPASDDTTSAMSPAYRGVPSSTADSRVLAPPLSDCRSARRSCDSSRPVSTLRHMTAYLTNPEAWQESWDRQPDAYMPDREQRFAAMLDGVDAVTD